MTTLATSVRRTAVVLGATAAGLVVAGPAGAAVPEGWSDPAAVDPFHAILVLGGLPLLIAAVIALLTYAPSLMRGERIAPGAPTLENQWLGGPRKGTHELAGPDSEESEAGGASARW